MKGVLPKREKYSKAYTTVFQVAGATGFKCIAKPGVVVVLLFFHRLHVMKTLIASSLCLVTHSCAKNSREISDSFTVAKSTEPIAGKRLVIFKIFCHLFSFNDYSIIIIIIFIISHKTWRPRSPWPFPQRWLCTNIHSFITCRKLFDHIVMNFSIYYRTFWLIFYMFTEHCMNVDSEF